MAADLFRSFMKLIDSNKSRHDEHRMSDGEYEVQCNNLKKKIEACKGKQLAEHQAEELINMM
jgi:hypothetical protein